MSIAVIPPWSGFRDFEGYSAAAVGEQPLAWELSSQAMEGLGPRIEAARAYWDWRASGESWDLIQDTGMAHLERHLGPHRRYWAADGGKFPPRAVIRYTPPSHHGVYVCATLGMSARRAPAAVSSAAASRCPRRP